MRLLAQWDMMMLMMKKKKLILFPAKEWFDSDFFTEIFQKRASSVCFMACNYLNLLFIETFSPFLTGLNIRRLILHS